MARRSAIVARDRLWRRRREFLYAAVEQFRDRTDDAALRAFHASNAYLAAVLVMIVVQALVTAA